MNAREYPYINEDGDLIMGPEQEQDEAELAMKEVFVEIQADAIAARIFDLLQKEFPDTHPAVVAFAFAKSFSAVTTGMIVEGGLNLPDQQAIDLSIEMVREQVESNVARFRNTEGDA